MKKLLKKILPEKLIWWLGSIFPAKPFLSDVAGSERLVEYGWVYNNLPKSGTILDIGASGSWFAHSLASLGYSANAVDWKKTKSTHPNLHCIQNDIAKLREPILYDAITCISALEHIALRENYVHIIQNLQKYLKPDGILLVTVPCGVPKNLNGFVVFSVDAFEDADYFKLIKKGIWVKVDKDKVSKVNHENKDEVQAIMCARIRR